MQVYLVGGAVRDKLLQRPVIENDYVVVGATPKQMLDLGFQKVGADFPVFLHPHTHEEYALARTERKAGKGYLGFTVYASPDVSLEQDLARRDLTINAMAIQVNGLFDNTIKTGELIDPFNGQKDLHQRQLRHVSYAFTEDPVRVLRLARFASRYASLGFFVCEETKQLVKHMITAGELNNLVAERVWTETQKSYMQSQADIYFSTLHELGALSVIMPELAQQLNHSQWQITAQALRQAHDFSLDNLGRFAILATAFLTKTHLLQKFCQRLKVPNQHRQFAQFFIENFYQLSHFHHLNTDEMFDLLKRGKAFKPENLLSHGLIYQQIYQLAKQQYQFNQIIEKLQPISIQNIDKNLTGKAIGEAIDSLRKEKLHEVLMSFH